MKKDIYDSIIIGGGFYGLYIADFIASQGKRVLSVSYTHLTLPTNSRV